MESFSGPFYYGRSVGLDNISLITPVSSSGAIYFISILSLPAPSFLPLELSYITILVTIILSRLEFMTRLCWLCPVFIVLAYGSVLLCNCGDWVAGSGEVSTSFGFLSFSSRTFSRSRTLSSHHIIVYFLGCLDCNSYCPDLL